MNDIGDIVTYISLQEMGIKNENSLGCISDYIYIGCFGEEGASGSMLYQVNTKGYPYLA